jgi:mannose-6-phosphate isomerase-like protein (cupin superfamily)
MIDALTDEILSFPRYENNQIIYIDKEGKDYKVKDEITYGNWIKTYKDMPHIKIEGLEDKSFHSKILKDFKLNHKVNSVHLFYNQYGGFSFPEHEDDTNVILYIVKGSKKIYIDKHPVLVKEEQAVFIPKGLKHKVDSLPNTWALSIGFN